VKRDLYVDDMKGLGSWMDVMVEGDVVVLN